MKKVLIVDDSALMRRVYCDIIEADKRFQIEDKAKDGLEALKLLEEKTYDVVILDINMPNMNGIQLLKELRKRKISAKVIVASTDTSQGAKVTIDALELGALDFIHKPDRVFDCKGEDFKRIFLERVEIGCDSKAPTFEDKIFTEHTSDVKVIELMQKHKEMISGNKIIAIACSTGGPKALQAVIPRIPQSIAAPILIVQHMPSGFTASLAERLNSLSEITVTEAKEGDIIEKGHAYLSIGGRHMTVTSSNGNQVIHYMDKPSREGVRPSANYMFESLDDSSYNEVVCVVMTGMGADGTEGIGNLKKKKKVHVMTQEQSTCAVYGMPKSTVQAGLSDQEVALEKIAQEIILAVGVM